MRKLFLAIFLTARFFSGVTHGQSTCFDFSSNAAKVECNSYPKGSLEYQNCFFQWFGQNKKALGLPPDSVCGFYNVLKGKNNAYLSGTKIPWISNYFLFIHGGIATKWQSDEFDPKYYKYNPETHTSLEELGWDRVNRMSKEELDKLSAAEKYDIYQGFQDFRVTKWELENRGPLKEDLADWEGHCNGVRAAGIFLPEPLKKITVSSKADPNIKITFYPTDLKALGIASCSYVTEYNDVGNPKSATDIPNPVIFDVALRLLIGNNIYPILFDRFSDLDRIKDTTESNEIWNTTIVGYNRVIGVKNNLFKSNQYPTARKAWNIITTVNTIEDVDDVADFEKSSKVLINQKNRKFVKSKTYKYKLFLDAQNRIVGGDWIGNYPNHLWFATGEGTQYAFNVTTKETELEGNENLDYNVVKDLIEKANSGK